MLDFIGDIHGHINELKKLLTKLGYESIEGVYQHPERTAFFLGDYIDRGPDSPGVVNLVRAMVDAGHAKAIMGNHEYNAILYNTKVGTNYLRRHSNKNNKQHRATLDQYAGDPQAYQAAIHWFKTLPLYYEDQNVRAVHACWHQSSVDIIHDSIRTILQSEEDIINSADYNHGLNKAVGICTKGLETHLPNGLSFEDKDGHKRQAMRIKWWNNPINKTLKEMSVLDDIDLPYVPFDKKFDHYPADAKPVFFGHYWLKGTPKLLTPNACCLDYSVAKNGNLCAYRWSGEQVLDASNLVYV